MNNGSFSFKSGLSTQKIKKIRYLKSGVSINSGRLKDNENTNMEYNIDTYLDNGHLIHLTGQFSIIPTISCDLVISGFTIQSFNISYDVQEQTNLAASVDLLNLQYDNEVELANITFDPIIVFIAGLPVVLVPELEIDAGTDLNVQSAVTTSANQQLTYNVGLNYANNQWTPFQTYTNSLSYQPPILTSTAEAKVYIKPKLQIAVYGFISPYLFGEGYARIQADVLATPWWSLYAGANGGVGVHMEIFGMNYDYETNPPLFEYETLLASAVGQLPTVSTNSISNITQTSATSGGSITSQGSSAITARGVCWSTSQNPIISDAHTTNGTGTGTFISNISGLTPNTPYQVRAYATNSQGTSYGGNVQFTTLGNQTGNLVAYYPFTGNANDVSGNGYNGTVESATLTTDRHGNTNSAYLFDGNTSYISIPSNAINNLPTGTVAAFIYLSQLGIQSTILDKTNTDSINFFQFIVDVNNHLRVLINGLYGSETPYRSNTALNQDQWYHVAVTWDGTNIKFYLNGALDATSAFTSGVPSASRQPYIGKVDNNTAYMNGKIDELRIYNYALSQSEIQALANQ